jgi:hypothetical protein
MTTRRDPGPIPAWAGLCATCGHARAISTGRGSTFVLCDRSKTDSRYRRYPILPVLTCTGAEPGTAPDR